MTDAEKLELVDRLWEAMSFENIKALEGPLPRSVAFIDQARAEFDNHLRALGIELADGYRVAALVGRYILRAAVDAIDQGEEDAELMACAVSVVRVLIDR